MNNLISAESQFLARQSRTHKLLASAGNVGTEALTGKKVSDQEAARYGKRRLITAGVGVATAAASILGAKAHLDTADTVKAFQNRVAACATYIEGHDVNLKHDSSGELIVPASDKAVVDACQVADGDARLAKESLGQTPSEDQAPEYASLPKDIDQYPE